nr:hypothetical protein Iba_chr10dCG11780 [Ipomoea batatas]
MHGIDDAQIVSNLALPMVEQSVEHAQSEFELDGGVVTQLECISHAAQVDREDDDLVDELQEEGDDKDDEEEGLVGEDYNFVDVVSAYDFEWARVDAESEDVGMGENEQVQKLLESLVSLPTKLLESSMVPSNRAFGVVNGVY